MDTPKGHRAIGIGHRAVKATELTVAVLCGLTATGALACEKTVSPFAQRPPFTVRSASAAVSADSGHGSPAAPVAARPVDATVNAAAVTAMTAITAMTSRIGIALGGLTYGPEVASAAVLRARSGTVAVRRTGEPQFADVGIETRLYPGDQIMTGDGARAMLLVADQTVIELGDSSAVVVGSHATGAAPAASAGVLGGIARFSVSPRVPGEGPFLTFVGGGVIAVAGTTRTPTAATFVVGLAAPGLARIGVESGKVEVAGPGALKKPVSVAGGEAVNLDPRSGVSRPSPFPDDDWASWRPATERRVPPEVWTRDQAQRLPALQANIDQVSGDLIKVAARALELTAQTSEDTFSRSAQRRYKLAAPEYAAAIEATFRLSVDLQRLVAALLSETFSLEKQLARKPDAPLASSVTAAPIVTGALLYNKKVQTVVDTTVAPIRPLYFVHHPSGRRYAHAVGVDVPAFFAETPLDPLPASLVDALVKRDIYAPPVVDIDEPRGGATTRTVTLGSAKPDWDAWLVVPPAPAREASSDAPADASRPTAEAELKFRASRAPTSGNLKTH